MRRATLVSAIVAIASLVVAGCSSSRHAAPPVPATTVPTTSKTAATVATPAGLVVARVAATPAQTMKGFGASGAWWPNDLAEFPTTVQQRVGQLLFSPQGIALSGYRYNIGGGGVGVTTPARAPNEVNSDTAGLIFLRAASNAHVPILTGFVNSAPAQFTTNHKSCGGSLIRGDEKAYAQYLASVVEHLHDADHITLNYVSPMNEPDDSFPDCGQEGMKVPVKQRAPVVATLGQALARQAPYARVIADETTADSILADEAPTWLAIPGANGFLAAIAHHSFDSPNATRRLLPPISNRFGKPTWMTEICCYEGSGGVASSVGAQYDPTMTQGLWLADQIYGDLTIARDSAWYWWTALSPALGCDPKRDPSCPTRVNSAGSNDGLLYYDERGATNGVTGIFPTDRFYVLGQFSRYVRPGAVRHDVAGSPAGVHVMAFQHGLGDRDPGWTIVAWNEGGSASRFGVALPGPETTAKSATATSAASPLASARLPERTDTGSWLLQLAPRTIVTVNFG